MPEGHTIHRIARDHRKWFQGQRLAMLSPQGRFEDEARTLSGRTLLRVDAVGKHLFYDFGKRYQVHVHLGLYGKFRIHRNPAPEPRGAVRWRVVGAERSFDLNGPTRCAWVDATDVESVRQRLGDDPLRSDADPDRVWQRISRSRAPLGGLLLNQEVIAGVGNVYRAEILNLVGLHPERAGRSLSRDEFDALWTTTVRLLKVGVRYNRIITVERKAGEKPLSRLNASERLNVYRKSTCLRCSGPVRQWMLASRKMYACDQCQPDA